MHGLTGARLDVLFLLFINCIKNTSYPHGPLIAIWIIYNVSFFGQFIGNIAFNSMDPLGSKINFLASKVFTRNGVTKPSFKEKD